MYDNNGNKINSILTYDTNTKLAIIETGTTSYCYMYFDLVNNLDE